MTIGWPDQWIGRCRRRDSSCDREWTGRTHGPWVIVEPPTGSNATDSRNSTLGKHVFFSISTKPAPGQGIGRGWEVNPLFPPFPTAEPSGELHSLRKGFSFSPPIPEDLAIRPWWWTLFLTSSQDIKKFSTTKVSRISSKNGQGLQTYFQMSPNSTSAEVHPK